MHNSEKSSNFASENKINTHMKQKFFVLVLAVATVFCGCTALKQAIALKDCKYTYSRMTDITFMGMNTNQMATFGGAAQLAMGLLGNTPAPLGFTIHLDVANPNQTNAAVESLYYKVGLDNIEVADGALEEPFVVPAGGDADLPLKISVDVKNLLQSEKRATMTKVIRNLVGVSNEPTDVIVQLKPTIRVGNSTMTSPVYFPVKFVYSGKKTNQQTATY